MPDLCDAYRGRFAPTPSGPLHFGSLVAALGSYLDARANHGVWLLRIEDLDTPRNEAGALDRILRQLEACALHWDETIEYQSANRERYVAALARLQQQGLVFRCGCTRREIADSSLRGVEGPVVRGLEGPVYPGTCRAGVAPGRSALSWRMRVANALIAVNDLVQGTHTQDLAHEVGDFVVQRADGVFAYQLAVVVDDAAQGITRVVRGADLLHSTARQMHLQRALGLPTPQYAHLPVALHADGSKLSKQTGATAVDSARASAAIAAALRFLNHAPPAALARAPAAELLGWATQHWRLSQVPRRSGMAIA